MIWNMSLYSNKKALIDEYGNSMTYNELEKAGSDLAGRMAKRCVVFSLCTNTIGSVLGYTAFLNNGIVPVMLNAHLERELLDNLLYVYKPNYIWCPVSEADILGQGSIEFEEYDYALIKTKFESNYPIYDELALLLTTSGSTGSPKFVRQSYDNIKANTDSIVEYLELDDSERPITTLPMNYTYGLSIINTHLAVGATILLTDKTLMQKEFWKFFKEEEATSFGGVPYTYEMLNKLRFFRMELPSLRTMTQAGGKLSPELHEKFAEYASNNGKKFFVMYGQCEATARMGYLPYRKAVEKKGSMGIAIPGGVFSLIDTDNKEITTPFVTGELMYKGKNVTLGYAECIEDLAKGDERGGVLVTGDMAQFDEDGYYYIVGRKKRFLKVFGNRVNMDEMDRLIKDEFGIEVACGGVDDCMYLFVTDATMCEKVKAYAVKKTRLNSSAFKTIVIDEIPKNDAGKVLYTKLSAYYENGNKT